ncbi:ergothioneine biosynthesis protein EgtB [uncultured Pseudokineococcus sp.]|uniref:ergothioneine biosynthesis protein EgtB n=1 Tax=uncultured Pseudokineococcus sp. TaxID=1642928 RepID=UPI00260348B9|nr:ergothioneine biosynthesis protein EgtB [uncultured Pseudokineococcus sp.]
MSTTTTTTTTTTGTAGALERPGPDLQGALAALERARAQTLRLTDVPEDELVVQHSALMSPLVWDLAHVGQQEEHWLLGDAAGLGRAACGAVRPRVFAPEVASLYDAAEHPRATRTSLPLLDAAASRRSLAEVRGRVLDALARAVPDTGATHDARDGAHRGLGSGGPADAAVFAASMTAQHEHQHDETMLATHGLRAGEALLVAEPVPRARPGAVPDAGADPRADSVLVPGGSFALGADPLAEPFALDNELPQHRVDVAAFRLGRLPVTCGQWARFVADGGYDDPRWWTDRGWRHRCEAGLQAPLGWAPDGAGGFTRRRFGVVEEVPEREPVQHVDFHEAQAFARWAGARLPTEVEWEKACAHDPATAGRRRWPWGEEPPTPERATLGGRSLRPAEAGALPASASACGAEQMVGDVWEWTSSGFEPWPGFRTMLYDGYSAPFFGGDYRVLRGGSWATDAAAVRPSFRNWDHPVRRQVFAGLRLAWDA